MSAIGSRGWPVAASAHRRRLPPRRRDLTLAALGFAIVIGGIYLGPSLLGGRVLTPATMLYLLAPWATVQPHGLGSYLNPLLQDVPTQFVPWLSFARSAVHHGFLPTWNPLIGGGTPFFANAQTATLSPFTVLAYVFSLRWALGFIAFAKLWVAAIGTFLLARELGARPVAAALGGLSFAFCSFNIVWLSHPHTNVSVLLPLALWRAELALRRGRLADGWWLAIVVAAAFLGGHPGTQVHFGFALVLYVVGRLAAAWPGRQVALARIGLIAGGIAAGLLVDAVALVPAAREVSAGSSVSARSGGGITNPASVLRTIAFPDWWGRPTGSQLGGPINYNERTLYAGAVAAGLAAVAAVSPRRWRTIAPLALIGAIGLATSLGVPVVHAVVVALPGLDTVQDARLLLLFELAVSVCAAIGFEELLSCPRPPVRYWLVLLAMAVVGAIAVLDVGPTRHELHLALDGLLSDPLTAVDPKVVTLRSVLLWLAFVAGLGLAGLLLARARWARGRAVVGAGVLVLAAADALIFAGAFQPQAPAAHAFAPATPAIRFLERHRDEGRFVGLGTVMLNDYPMVYGLRDVRSYDPPYPDRPYLALWRVATPGQSDSAGLVLASLTPSARAVLDLLGTRWIVEPPGSPPPSLPGLREVYRGPDAVILDNDAALARVSVPATVTTVASEGPLLSALANGQFDPSRAAAVQTNARAPIPAGAGSATVARSDDTHVVIHSRLTTGGLVVLDDVLASGWTVRIDGRPARSLRVDAVMRGVVVPAGSHTVQWSYQAPGLQLGLGLSGLGVVLLVGVGVVAWRRRGTPVGRPASA